MWEALKLRCSLLSGSRAVVRVIAGDDEAPGVGAAFEADAVAGPGRIPAPCLVGFAGLFHDFRRGRPGEAVVGDFWYQTRRMSLPVPKTMILL